MKLKSNQLKASDDQVVKDIRRATRRHYSTEDKIRIVLSSLRGDDSIAVTCPRVSPTNNLCFSLSVCPTTGISFNLRRHWHSDCQS
jgi:transposase